MNVWDTDEDPATLPRDTSTARVVDDATEMLHAEHFVATLEVPESHTDE